MGRVIMSGIVPLLTAPKTTHIYGAIWDGSSSTAWTRTDEAVGFADPNPAVANGTGSSPFDNIMPWAGMQRVTDSEAGELVSIPKFWYKWTKDGNSLKLQIANGAVDGFYVSPAHADRGDGKGERDMVYVGRYHCGSDYKSTSGVKPIGDITRPYGRSNIHNLGATIWQSDFSMRQTIWLLYLAEFADWDSQTKIGYGCGNNTITSTMGYTDSMNYHTGTTRDSRTTYGVGTQYRYVEGLWDNVQDWVDGCYNNNSGLNIIMNPVNFSDSSNGIVVGTPSNGYPSEMSISTVSGVQWIYPSTSNGSSTTYVTDTWNSVLSSQHISCGGYFHQELRSGLFCISNHDSTSFGSYSGTRLMKLP